MSTKLTFKRDTLLSHLRTAAAREKTRIAREAQKAQIKHDKSVKDEIKKLEQNLAAAKRGEPFYPVHENWGKTNPAAPEPESSSKLLEQIENASKILSLSAEDEVTISLERDDKIGLSELLRKVL